MAPGNHLWHRKYPVCAILLSAALCLAFSCGRMFPTLAGSVTEGGNVEVASGYIVDEAGVPDAHVQVMLVPSGYKPESNAVPSNILSDTTDVAGSYRFLNIDSGRYTIQAVHIDKRTRAVSTGIRIIKTNDTIADITLHRPGAIEVVLPDTVDTVNGYVFIPGTTIYKRISGNMHPFIMDSIPSGMLGGLYYAEQNSTNAASLLRDSITVTPGETTTVACTAWKSMMKIHLNTSLSGAAIAGSVVNFPVLIRLTDTNFNFAQAKSDGGDIRFTKMDAAALPYEIERWDAITGRAEIWVKVDTIYGNNSTQYVIMYWGNPAAANASSGPAVFDTMQGFQGVWHMGQAGNTTALDATINHYNGSPSGMTAASAVPGAVGISQHFTNPTGYIRMQNTASSKLDFADPLSYTVSAWVNSDSLDGKLHYILSKGEYRYHFAQYSGTNPEWHFDIFSDQRSRGEYMTCGKVEKKWTYVAGVHRGTTTYLYVDGVCIDSSITVDLRGSDATKYDLVIGARTETLDGNFKGNIDEVRLSNVARGMDWVRLCFMNQKTNDALVVLR